jgi:hypothetical protein
MNCFGEVELFCAQTPKTCKNFLALAASGVALVDASWLRGWLPWGLNRNGL